MRRGPRVRGPITRGVSATGRRVVLHAGFAAIDFDGGARILLQGPATFVPQSAGSAWLGEGSVDGPRFPPEATGFARLTPNALIVDQGTEFGVAVEADGRSEVEVFDGRVELVPGAVEDDGAAPQTLHRGEALRVLPAVAGELPQIERLAAGTRQFVRALPGRRLACASW